MGVRHITGTEYSRSGIELHSPSGGVPKIGYSFAFSRRPHEERHHPHDGVDLARFLAWVPMSDLNRGR